MTASVIVLLFLSLQGGAQTPVELPETFEVWLCPIHSDEQSTGEGNCSICERPYERRDLVSIWSCPMHSQIEEPHAGEYPICRMGLTRTTRYLEWYCPGHDDVASFAPGRCPHDNRRLEWRSVAMAHGDHNPKHGGMLFMSSNGFHHIEGTLSENGEFRLYIYDNFTKPIDPRPFAARVEDVELSPSTDGSYLSGELDGVSFPAEVVLHVRFDEGEDEQRFDFAFTGNATPSTEKPAQFSIPNQSHKIYQEILNRNEHIQELIHRGAWPDLYIPALEAKDLALALSAKEGAAVVLPVKTIVRAAWLLDFYGDLGDKTEVESAYRLFESGIEELELAHQH